MAMAVTMSVARASYAAFNSDLLVQHTEVIANSAACRTVDAAIVGYLAGHGAAPADTDQIRPDVRGDVSAYRIVDGRAVGPGCPA